MILADALRAAADAATLAQKIQGAIGKPFTLPGGAAKVTVSIGVGLYPEDGRDADVLLKAADVAMYRAKRKSVSRYTCTAGASLIADRRADVANAAALAAGSGAV